jgi:hypothetical protein
MALRPGLRSCATALAVLGLAIGSIGRATPAPGDLPPRVVAIGDIHGSLDGLVSILQHAELIDRERQWIGGSTLLVQTGDFTDRGPQVRGVMDLLMDLERQAAAAGGQVRVALGNHELMNMLGELRDVTPAIYASFAEANSTTKLDRAYDRYHRLARRLASRTGPQGPPVQTKEEWLASRPPGFIEYQEAFAPHGVYGRWLRTKPAVIRVGDIIFLHGGLNPDVQPADIDRINRTAAEELRAFDEARALLVRQGVIEPFFTISETVIAVQVELAILPIDHDPLHLARLRRVAGVASTSLLDPNGPFWFRGLAMWDQQEGRAALERLHEMYGATHFVIGHTIPATGRITPRFDGRVFLIDTGMLTSHYPMGRPSALEIRDGEFIAIYEDGRVPLGEVGSQ